MSITTLIKVIQDIMRKDVGVDGDAQRISQICWLLFLKIFDDKETEWEITRRAYKSPLPSRFRWRNWAKDPEGDTGEDLIGFVNNHLFPELKQLASKAGVSPEGKVVGSVFEDAYNYMKSGTLLRQVINTIEEDVDFNSSKDRHLFNDIYEKILADLQSAGNAGEYYTPRAVTQFMVDILNPRLGESILDPACGTGGFLTCSIEHLKKQAKTAEDLAILQDSINGVEKKPLPHMLAMTNMMLHGIDVPTKIRHDNTLSRPYKDYGPKDRVDIVLTNPPFGGMEEDGIEKNFLAKHQTRETADLFMALIMHLLKHDTGRAAVVLPDGFLFGEGVKTTLKKQLLEEFNLHTIVRLPKGVFSPYTSINTNLLFFEKGGPTKAVWFFEHPYPDGYKSYSRSKPLTIDEFDLEKKWWGGASRKGRRTTPHAWKVSAERLAERNYNFDSNNPHVEVVEHSAPEELSLEYQRIIAEMQKTQGALKAELTAALTATRGDQSALIARHFDTAFTAPEGPAKLRELILTIAMQGRLVPQDHDDPPASRQLRQIEAERKRLVKEAKLIASLPPTPMAPDEAPYTLPMGWEWVRLGSIAVVERGGSPRPINSFLTDASDGLNWIKIGDTEKGGKYVTSTKEKIRPEGLSKTRMVYPGDFLLTNSMSFGRPYITQIEGCIHDGWLRISPPSSLNKDYLYYLLSSSFVKTLFEFAAAGAVVQNLNADKVREIVIPLPPEPEQHRIVAAIDRLMSMCDSLEQQINDAKQLQSALLNAVMMQLVRQPCA